jgi:hypothetical protein
MIVTPKTGWLRHRQGYYCDHHHLLSHHVTGLPVNKPGPNVLPKACHIVSFGTVNLKLGATLRLLLLLLLLLLLYLSSSS